VPFASLEQVGVTLETLMPVGCLVIRTPHRHEEAGITKDTMQAARPIAIPGACSAGMIRPWSLRVPVRGCRAR